MYIIKLKARQMTSRQRFHRSSWMAGEKSHSRNPVPSQALEDRRKTAETHHLFSLTSLPSPPNSCLSTPFTTFSAPHLGLPFSCPDHFSSALLPAHPVSPSFPCTLVLYHPTLLLIFLCSASQVSPLKPHCHTKSIFSLSSYSSALN